MLTEQSAGRHHCMMGISWRDMDDQLQVWGQRLELEAPRRHSLVGRGKLEGSIGGLRGQTLVLLTLTNQERALQVRRRVEQ